MNSALAATVAAAASGENSEIAIEIGKKAGSKTATSWTDLARSGNALAANYGTNYPALPNNSSKNNFTNVKKSKLAKVAPFTKGNASPSTNGINIVSQKPSYMNNKCLVIRGLDKEISRANLQAYINSVAGRNINILHDQPISKTYSKWLTIAIETNPEDYETLNNPSLWQSGLEIREFVGWRWWRSEKPKRLTTHDIRSSLRMQWKD